MSETIQTKKITELTENTTLSDGDLLIMGDPETGKLKKTEYKVLKDDTNKDSIKYDDVVDNLLSDSDNLPLSAKQGKALKESVDQLNSNLVTANNALSGKQDKSKYSDECRVISVATTTETGIQIKHPSNVSLALLIITSGGVVASVNKGNGSSKSTVTEIIGNFIAHTGDQNNTYLKTGTYIRSLILFTSSNPSSITIGTYTSS